GSFRRPRRPPRLGSFRRPRRAWGLGSFRRRAGHPRSAPVGRMIRSTIRWQPPVRRGPPRRVRPGRSPSLRLGPARARPSGAAPSEAPPPPKTSGSCLPPLKGPPTPRFHPPPFPAGAPRPPSPPGAVAKAQRPPPHRLDDLPTPLVFGQVGRQTRRHLVDQR